MDAQKIISQLYADQVAKGFGFLNGKPSSAFSAVAVTPDEMGYRWDGTRLHGQLKVYWSEDLFGTADAGADMHFGLAELISHGAKTCRWQVGTIIGSGTVSNRGLERRNC